MIDRAKKFLPGDAFRHRVKGQPYASSFSDNLHNSTTQQGLSYDSGMYSS